MALGEKLFTATHANLEGLPEQSGVFTLYEDGQMIFIGRADDDCVEPFRHESHPPCRVVVAHLICAYRAIVHRLLRLYQGSLSLLLGITTENRR